MFFDSWEGLARVVLVGVPAYAGLVVILRLSGKRTLSKMNAFDLIVTVALGSTLATILTSGQVALAEGMLALVLLIGLQFSVAWAAARSKTVDSLVKADPVLLYFRGSFLRSAMRRERVTEGEIRAAIREAGLGACERAEAVVLETAGEFSVIPRTAAGDGEALGDVRGVPEATNGEV